MKTPEAMPEAIAAANISPLLNEPLSLLLASVVVVVFPALFAADDTDPVLGDVATKDAGFTVFDTEAEGTIGEDFIEATLDDNFPEEEPDVAVPLVGVADDPELTVPGKGVVEIAPGTEAEVTDILPPTAAEDKVDSEETFEALDVETLPDAPTDGFLEEPEVVKTLPVAEIPEMDDIDLTFVVEAD